MYYHHLPGVTPEDEPDTDNAEVPVEYLTFSAGGDFALPIADVLEIMPLAQLMPLPDVPEFIVGLYNRRGQVIPIVDVRARLHRSSTTYTVDACIIVVRCDFDVVGLRVDGVRDVLRLCPSELQPAPTLADQKLGDTVSNIGATDRGDVLILDLPALLYAELPPSR